MCFRLSRVNERERERETEREKDRETTRDIERERKSDIVSYSGTIFSVGIVRKKEMLWNI